MCDPYKDGLNLLHLRCVPLGQVKDGLPFQGGNPAE